MTDQPTIRDARDDDAAGLIELIGSVFAEYPGCLLDVDGEIPELRAIASHFAAVGGRFWVAELPGASGGPLRVVGCGGLSPASEPGGVELRKLYVHEDARRTGLGTAFCDLVEAEARRRGAAYVDLWSDTRFDKAHRLYERRGYVRGPATRDLHDISHSTEYYFRLAL
jgi:putative acetyltransferase